MITRTASVTVPRSPELWPPGWDDVEVVDGVLVEEAAAPAGERPVRAPGAGLYDRSGRAAPGERCGALVSVLA